MRYLGDSAKSLACSMGEYARIEVRRSGGRKDRVRRRQANSDWSTMGAKTCFGEPRDS